MIATVMSVIYDLSNEQTTRGIKQSLPTTLRRVVFLGFFMWHYQKEGKTWGPCSDTILRTLLERGSVSSDTQVRQVGTDKWIILGESAILSESDSAAPRFTETQTTYPVSLADGGILRKIVTPFHYDERPLKTRHWIFRSVSWLSWHGRMSHISFLLKIWLPMILIGPAIGYFDKATHFNGWLVFYLVLAFIPVWLAAMVRRLHDMDRSAAFLLLLFVPIVGPLWIISEAIFCHGTKGTNHFGPDPSRE